MRINILRNPGTFNQLKLNNRKQGCSQKKNFGAKSCICYNHIMGAQLLSGRVLDYRLRGRGFDPHRRHCVVVLDQDTFILA